MTRRWKKIHAVGLKQSMQGLYLFLGVSLLGHLLGRYEVLGGPAQPAEELLHLARGLVRIDDFAWLAAYAAPHVRNIPRHKNAFTRTEVEAFVAYVKLEFALHDVDPFILIVMQMGRPAAGARELEHAHRAIGVLVRYFAIVWLAARSPECDLLVESIFSGGDAEADKHFLGLHLLSSFQVRDGFINCPK